MHSPNGCKICELQSRDQVVDSVQGKFGRISSGILGRGQVLQESNSGSDDGRWDRQVPQLYLGHVALHESGLEHGSEVAALTGQGRPVGLDLDAIYKEDDVGPEAGKAVAGLLRGVGHGDFERRLAVTVAVGGT